MPKKSSINRLDFYNYHLFVRYILLTLFWTLNLDFWTPNLDSFLWGVTTYLGKIPWISCYSTNGTLCTLIHWSLERESTYHIYMIISTWSHLPFVSNLSFIYRHLFILDMIQPHRKHFRYLKKIAWALDSANHFYFN